MMLKSEKLYWNKHLIRMEIALARYQLALRPNGHPAMPSK